MLSATNSPKFSLLNISLYQFTNVSFLTKYTVATYIIKPSIFEAKLIANTNTNTDTNLYTVFSNFTHFKEVLFYNTDICLWFY